MVAVLTCMAVACTSIYCCNCPEPSSGPSPAGGQWCPAPPFEIGAPHFTFGPPVTAHINYCMLKMWPPFWFLPPPAAKSWRRAWPSCSSVSAFSFIEAWAITAAGKLTKLRRCFYYGWKLTKLKGVLKTVYIQFFRYSKPLSRFSKLYFVIMFLQYAFLGFREGALLLISWDNIGKLLLGICFKHAGHNLTWQQQD